MQEYLQSREWDGVPRLDTLFSDYFGDADCPYTRAVARKSLVAAVARAMEPGCQYDQVPVVCGPQGVGKSTFFTKLGGPWFSNSVTTFDGKEAAEQIQGCLLYTSRQPAEPGAQILGHHTGAQEPAGKPGQD